MPSQNHRPADDGDKTVVYFDGSCPLCSAEIGYYASRDTGGRLRFVDVADGEAELGPDLAREDALRRFHVRSPDGSLSSGARGFADMWAALPGWRGVTRIARLPGVLPLLELGYRAFLPVRPFLSRLASRFGAEPATTRRPRS